MEPGPKEKGSNMSENEKTPTDAGTPVETEIAAAADSRCWRTSIDEGRSGNGKRDPRGN